MPITPTHQKKKAKNYALLIAILSFIVIVFWLTMIKLQTGYVDDASKPISMHNNTLNNQENKDDTTEQLPSRSFEADSEKK